MGLSLAHPATGSRSKLCIMAASQLAECFPARPLDGSSWVHKAVSPSGQETMYRCSELKDLEDDDKHQELKIGTLELRHDDEMGRDFGRELFTVSYRGKVICSSGDQRARAARFNKPMTIDQGSAGDVLAALEEVAALNLGLTWKCSLGRFLEFNRPQKQLYISIGFRNSTTVPESIRGSSCPWKNSWRSFPPPSAGS